MEGWRIVRVEENPYEITQAGYHTQMIDGHLFTDASVDWAPDDFSHIDRPVAVETPIGTKPDITQEKPPVTIPAPPEPPFSAAPESTITPDDLFNEFTVPTEVDKKIVTGEVDPTAPRPEMLNASKDDPLGDGKRPGNLSDSEFKETRMAVEIAHHAIINGNAWAMHMVTGEGKIEDYKQFEQKRFDMWSEIGAKLADKYGVKFPLEALYFMAAGQNLGPGWQLAITNYQQRKKIQKLEATNEELRWKNYLMQNVGNINPQAPPPPPPPQYPTAPPPQKTEDIQIHEENGWVHNSLDDFWTNRKTRSRIPAVDGDFIFNPQIGQLVHKVTGIPKKGRPKGITEDGPRKKKVWRGPNGKFLNKEEIAKGLADGTLEP